MSTTEIAAGARESLGLLALLLGALLCSYGPRVPLPRGGNDTAQTRSERRLTANPSRSL